MRTKFNGVIGEITTLPGCSQVGVSHGVFLPKEQRGQGLAKKANEERCEFMREELGYDYSICTVAEDNEVQAAIMRKNGWMKLDCFMSRKTDHLVHIYGKQL